MYFSCLSNTLTCAHLCTNAFSFLKNLPVFPVSVMGAGFIRTGGIYSVHKCAQIPQVFSDPGLQRGQPARIPRHRSQSSADTKLPHGKAAEETYAYSLAETRQILNLLPPCASTICAVGAFAGLRRGEI